MPVLDQCESVSDTRKKSITEATKVNKTLTHLEMPLNVMPVPHLLMRKSKLRRLTNIDLLDERMVPVLRLKDKLDHCGCHFVKKKFNVLFDA